MNEECKRLLNGDLSEYKSIPFWSWNNALDERELEKQIEEMHAAGIGGFIMHARTGLKEEYLGEKWFSCISACLKKAKELGMEAWVYDENGWPSGFVGGKLILTETYACAGFDATPRKLASVGQTQYFRGVNKTCQHLYPYSLADQGKVDHPPVFGPHSNWGEGFKVFNDYFTRLGAIIGNTEERVDVAIIHPVREVWQEYTHAEDKEGGLSIQELGTAYGATLTALRKHGVTYHFIDESILARHGRLEGDTLRVGERAYGKVLVANMHTLAPTTYALLKGFTGKLCVKTAPTMLNGVPAQIELPANTTFEELLRGGELSYLAESGDCYIAHRKGEIGEFLFVQNTSATEERTVDLFDIPKAYLALDLSTFEESAVARELPLAPGEGVVLIRNEEGEHTPVAGTRSELTKDFRVTGITDNYLVLDYAEISKNGERFWRRYPVVGLMEGLLREDYKGELAVRYTFVLQEKMPLTLLMEHAQLKWAKINGREIAFAKSDFDVHFVEAEIGDLCKEGENEFTYAIDFWQHDGVYYALFDPMTTESLRNCLYYDTTIEPVYIKGDFTLDTERTLVKRTVLPPVCTDLYKRGYPFFKGLLTLEGSLDWDGQKRVDFGVEGKYHVAEVTVNGKRADPVLKTEREITPRHFTMRGQWEKGYPAEYGDGYNCVPFGVENIYKIER